MAKEAQKVIMDCDRFHVEMGTVSEIETETENVVSTTIEEVAPKKPRKRCTMETDMSAFASSIGLSYTIDDSVSKGCIKTDLGNGRFSVNWKND